MAELDCDPGLCASRNIHSRTSNEIEALFRDWQPTPTHFNRIDLRTFLQDREIVQVDMEDADENEVVEIGRKDAKNKSDEEDEVNWNQSRNQGEIQELRSLKGFGQRKIRS